MNTVRISLLGLALMASAAMSFAQRFSGGSGTQGDPYRISKPEDVIELSIYVETTLGKYYIMTNDIDMGRTKGFTPIGTKDSIKEGCIGACTDPIGTDLHPFRGNFNGNGFAIKNLIMIDTSDFSIVSFFGLTRDAVISNLTFDNAFFYGNTVAPFIYNTGWDGPLSMDNCKIINSTLKSSNGSIYGFVDYMNRGTINNCHIIHTTMEGRSVYGFCGQTYSAQITNSSVRYSTLTGRGYNAIGFVFGLYASSYSSGMISGCCVSNCNISAVSGAGGFGSATSGKIQNCYAQATLTSTDTMYKTYNGVVGFGHANGASYYDSALLLNSYAACEIIENTPPSGIYYAFGSDTKVKTRITNCYYNTDPPTSDGSGMTGAGLVGKTRSELKAAAMVAHPGTQSNSLNYGQSSAAWKQDFAANPINKGFPILAWQQHFTFASTYYPTIVNTTSVILHGFVFTDAAPIIERGFEWREVKAANWTKVQVSDTTTNISFALSSLTAGMYECKVYMKTASETNYGDTISFGVGTSIVTTLPAFNITETSAILYGFVEVGNDIITEQGFEWRTVGTTTWTKNIVGLGSGNILYMLTGLSKDAKYECLLHNFSHTRHTKNNNITL